MIQIIRKQEKHKVELTKNEINVIIDSLENCPYNYFVFFNCDKIIKKLKKYALSGTGVKDVK